MMYYLQKHKRFNTVHIAGGGYKCLCGQVKVMTKPIGFEDEKDIRYEENTCIKCWNKLKNHAIRKTEFITKEEMMIGV